MGGIEVRKVMIIVIAIGVIMGCLASSAIASSGLVRRTPAPSPEPTENVQTGDAADLDNMTFVELVALNKRVLAAMWASGEWQEVEVPQGVYKIGEDIPAGRWTISPVPGWHVAIAVSSSLAENGNKLSLENYSSGSAYAEDSKYYEKGKATSLDLVLDEGFYISVGDGPAVFTPYTGPSFTFR